MLVSSSNSAAKKLPRCGIRVKTIIDRKGSIEVKNGVKFATGGNVRRYTLDLFCNNCYNADFVDPGALINIRTRRLSGSVLTPQLTVNRFYEM